MEVVGDQREGETGPFRGAREAHQLCRRVLLRREGVAELDHYGAASGSSGPMPITTGFNHIATLTPDIERHADFYRRVFGAEVTFQMDAA